MAIQTTDLLIDSVPFIMEGQVVSTADPDQMGRVKLWVPALDGENFDSELLPWAEYASPFLGFTVEYPAGNGTSNNAAHAAYGFWAIPKVGATVLVFCLNADPTARFYFASTPRLHRNRSLPAGRNVDFNGNLGPFGDDGDEKGNLSPLQPAYSNLREQFQNKISASEAQTRGAYERQVAQAKNDKDGEEGYATSPVDSSYLDPQTYCIVTPGHNAIIMQDDPKGARIRFKTAEGHQIIFDDTNERIYMSTAKGKSWVELDQDGHIHVFGSESISFRSGKNFNVLADGDINLEAGGNVNMKADSGTIKIQSGSSIHLKAASNILITACGDFDMSSNSSLKISADSDIDINSLQNIAVTATSNADYKSGSNTKMSASRIDLNGPEAKTAAIAACADNAETPPIVPGHEPWSRPSSSQTRNKRWKA